MQKMSSNSGAYLTTKICIDLKKNMQKNEIISDKMWSWTNSSGNGGISSLYRMVENQHLVNLMLEQAFFLTLRKGPLSHHFYALILETQPGTNYNKSILSSYHISH